ncbi:hypothetical protein DFH08DRAFT_221331 [Mycena albidolilacea]|uniref:Transmembrane protein n=1 Tax=Mycena albidolilacea TaxID=1033008 RepID=A0AAD6ZX26_9AGAR|nr:hypothetical protein DFH08DRAFT_221331 [Mycena albidolilacea]
MALFSLLTRMKRVRALKPFRLVRPLNTSSTLFLASSAVSTASSSSSDTQTSSSSSTSSSTPPNAGPPLVSVKKQNLAGPIAAGAVGGLVLLAALTSLFIHWIYRRRCDSACPVFAREEGMEGTEKPSLVPIQAEQTPVQLFTILPTGETQLSLPPGLIPRGIVVKEGDARFAAAQQHQAEGPQRRPNTVIPPLLDAVWMLSDENMSLNSNDADNERSRGNSFRCFRCLLLSIYHAPSLAIAVFDLRHPRQNHVNSQGEAMIKIPTSQKKKLGIADARHPSF